MLNQERWVCDIRDLDYRRMVEKIDGLLRNQHKIKEELRSKMAIIRRQSRLNAQLVRELIKESKK